MWKTSTSDVIDALLEEDSDGIIYVRGKKMYKTNKVDGTTIVRAFIKLDEEQ